MPRRKITFVEKELYHICNRGVEKRDIFLDDKDYFRAIHDLYEFNDTSPALNLYYKTASLQSYETRSRKIKNPIVEILAFTLMPNHYHLLLRQTKENGIVEFMQRFGVGYAMYFNKKYARVGSLFQGPFKAVHVTKNAHFIHIPFYIHANPLDLKFPEWREKKIKNAKQALEFLESYRWSSFSDYVGKRNFPSVIHKLFLSEIIGTPAEYKTMTLRLLQEMDLATLDDVLSIRGISLRPYPL